MFRRNYWFAILFSAVVMSLLFCSCTRRNSDAALALDDLSSPSDETPPPESAAPTAVLGSASDITTDISLFSDFQEESDGHQTGPVLEAREMIDDSFFDGAAFFGNSLMEGLGGYGGLENGAFFGHARTALYNMDTEKNTRLDDGSTGTLYQAMVQRQYEKIYVLLGINEIGWDASYFADRFDAFLERLREDEPEAEIYIMSLTPVTQETSETHEFFNMERVRAYNEELLALAEKNGCWYLDMCQALAGDDGYLPAERAADDGVHLTQDAYPLWADYLRTHYAGTGNQ